MDLYTKVFEQSCADVNEAIVNKFSTLSEQDFKERTHLFNGRYENLYLEKNKITELEVIINAALENAANILQLKKEQLVFGFWFNSMSAGDVTTAHTHDDDDEALSCVYYLKVPENSGDLIITENKLTNKKIIIKPKEGEFVFFSPATLHEVAKNNSTQSRLSVAFNFGLVRS